MEIDYLKNIIGLPFTDFNRAADLVWLAFGKIKPWKNYKGEYVDRCQFYVNAQCLVRFICDKSILLSSLSIYQLLSCENIENFDFIGNTAFDGNREQVLNLFKDNIVENFHISDVGDLTIFFRNKMKIEVINHSREDEEAWRFFGMEANTKHLVMMGSELKFH